MTTQKAENLPELIEIAIDGVAFGGDGVGRFNKQVVFVPFTVDGDVVAARITNVGRKFVRAVLEEILQPSPNRINPRCLYYGRCGGCQYQHISYDHQLRLKKQQTVDAFVRIGKVALPSVDSAVASPKIFNYRGKADYHVHVSPAVPPVIGFMDVSNRHIVDIQCCAIVDESINKACLVFRQSLASGALKTVSNRQTIWADDVAGGKTEVVTDFRAPRFITRTVKGQTLTAPYRGFFQANSSLLPEMIDAVINLGAPSGVETVVDAFCGSGLFSMFLAPYARHVYGIETEGEAVHLARTNSRQAGFKNTAFLRGDAAEVLRREFVKTKRKVDILILDPPRAGCDKALLEEITELKPAKIVYISCNPVTQARDINLLLDHGFILKNITPYDMFPQTAHIEVVALLESRR